jgi:hypothetical protein
MNHEAAAVIAMAYWAGAFTNHPIHFAVADFALAARLARTATSCGQTAKSFSEDCPS